MDWTEVAIPDDPHGVGITYVSGPMSGLPDYNYPAFDVMAHRLRSAGYRVISPHELHAPDASVAWDWYIRRDLAQLVKCGRIVMLPDWTSSKGAMLEHQVAKALGMDVIYPDEPGPELYGQLTYSKIGI